MKGMVIIMNEAEQMQSFVELPNKHVLIAEVDRMRKYGYRLAQASITKKEKYDVLYSFEKNGELVNLRLLVDIGDSIESVSGIYPYAYLYENEMQDLFGLKIRHINVSFKGNLYHTSVKTPFLNEK